MEFTAHNLSRLVDTFRADPIATLLQGFHVAAPYAVLAAVVLLAAWQLYRKARLSAALSAAAKVPRDYDALIIGASIAGPVLAIQLARQGRKVAVIETSLERPDRIVGELIQPGGLQALRELGLEHCATSVGVPCGGYTARFENKWVDLPYEKGVSGVSFHFGDFVTKLRHAMLSWNGTEEAIKCGGSITVLEGTATELITDKRDMVVLGAMYKAVSDKRSASVTAHLTVLCDGGFSKFRPTKKRLPVHSYFVGIILKDIHMPFEGRGHVMLCRSGPVLSYRLDKNEVRILADYNSTSLKNPTNDVLIPWLHDEILPQMPSEYQEPLSRAIEVAKGSPNAIRTHPHFRFTPIFPKYRGVVTCGDSGNTRHPLTGGGMTCALRDTIGLSSKLRNIPYLGDESRVHAAVLSYLRHRPYTTSVINVLSWALHGVFRGPIAMRRACFEYFRLGGDCVRTPMAFLSAINGSISLLLYHYVRVMIFGAYIVLCEGGKQGPVASFLGMLNPLRWVTALNVLLHAMVIFIPVVVVEFGAWGHLVDTTLVRF